MTLDKSTVQTIARLARLNVDDTEIDTYQSELSNILDLVEQMDTVNTDGIEPMTHPFDATLRLRDDIVTEQNQRDKYQAVAPSTENGLYLVPKVID
ncbi:aspartyl/glutamyl-tRNA(Asn/Gln) amidotransferase subunit C [Arenicella chitinivorans]|uniref:Aspartyl/glutamyl-tRNA(Asn/Gln) amidotransferase subunit C n=1 Tax=Arenicella chitinivorans TaxID=1329800 RepID=A0A918VQ72_9GAMM|nr:Asp-tRNA(Asn)/Glu-tRNA(Gln) amidotransferase subunit GatC [Arenicella chitinivorans]GHA16093.1 aspartyl/glutamyl-tRNA(Asn/Gln) amidotransferase subunit C [Arenicella chitinivorans]